jgi:phosphoribosylglycinamide formyltransferase-1
MPGPARLAVLASGSGSNAVAILEYFRNSQEVVVAFVGCNRSPEEAEIYQRTREFGMEVQHFSNADLWEGRLLESFRELGIDWVALAGFLVRIPTDFVAAFSGRMLNVHPSLLPKFGGKGMYGLHVHRAVIEAGEVQTGMTVHWVTARYDEGAVVFQAECEVRPDDTPDAVAARVLQLEHTYYPRTIAACIAAASS